jgi:outer membrane receptor protein involved in Fe transport
VELMGGTFGSASAEASVGGTAGRGHDYYVGGGYNREDGWRQVTGAKQYNGFVNLGKTWNSGGLRFQAYGAESDVQTAGSLPESVFEVKPDSNLSANDFEDLNSIQVALLGYRKLGSGQGSFNLFYRRHNADRFNANQPTDPDTYGESRNRVFGGTIDYRLATSAGSLPLGLRFGVDGSTSSTAVRLFADSVKFGGDRSLTTDVESPVSDLAAFGMADLVVGRATFSGGLRYDYVRGPFRNLLDPTRDTTQTWSRLNPRIGADVDLGSGVSVFGSWGTAFRAPSVIEVACADPEEPCPLPFALGDDPPIDAVVASTFELGARYTTGSWYFTGSAYRSYVKNDIVLFPYEEDEGEPEGSTIDGYFDNIDKTRREGLELTTRFAFGPGHLPDHDRGLLDPRGGGGRRERGRAGRQVPAGARAPDQGGHQPALPRGAPRRRRRALDRRAVPARRRGQRHRPARQLLRRRRAAGLGGGAVGGHRRSHEPLPEPLRHLRYLQHQPGGGGRAAVGAVPDAGAGTAVPPHRAARLRSRSRLTRTWCK